jgi:hypothetical protein
MIGQFTDINKCLHLLYRRFFFFSWYAVELLLLEATQLQLLTVTLNTQINKIKLMDNIYILCYIT